MQTKNLIIFTDGVAVPNPGKAGIGVVIKNEQGELIDSISRPIGYATNNHAEYQAIISALERAIILGAEQVAVRSDSELMVNQINSRYKVKNAALKPLHQKVKQLQNRFKSFKIIHVPREQNREADNLAGNSLK
jgi:ribonuclease HI